MSTLSVNERDSFERNSVVLVVVVAVISLILGGMVKTAVSDQTRTVTQNNITAEVPSGWLVQDGTGDLRIVVRNPQSLNTRYRVNVLDGDDLVVAAADRNETRARLDETYRVLEETPIVVNGRDGYKVSYAIVDAEDVGMPSVIEGVDYYFAEGDEIVVVSYEAEELNYAAGFPYFQQFRETVVYQAGG
ncbi:MAG: hypothetical protein DWQ04_04600 [Chloroflexi bacterium]|nr:MAG: hypothetical protein DWQ04_04600 [Chloroflexota bacterium]